MTDPNITISRCGLCGNDFSDDTDNLHPYCGACDALRCTRCNEALADCECEDEPLIAMPSRLATVERIMAEVRQDIAAGVVPSSVSSFGELHEYVDANTYGGLCDDGGFVDLFTDYDAWMDYHNRVSDDVDAWLAAGMHRTLP